MITWYNSNYTSHPIRGGWKYIIEHLEKNVYLKNFQKDLIIDTYVDFTFRHDRIYNRIYRTNWIGVIHHTFCKLDPYNLYTLLNNEHFLKSLKCNVCIIVLSEYIKKQIKEYLNKKNIDINIHVLYHPTEEINIDFCFNVNKINTGILHIGDFMRNHEAFLSLQCKKIIISRKKINIKWYDFYTKQISSYVSNKEYDKLLLKHICFLKLYDVSASNVVIECIMRNAPVIINRHPALEEYLGIDYPLFYDKNNKTQVMHLINNKKKIKEAHYYLKNKSKRFLKIDFFINEFINIIELYKDLYTSDFDIILKLPIEINDKITEYISDLRTILKMKNHISDIIYNKYNVHFRFRAPFGIFSLRDSANFRRVPLFPKDSRKIVTFPSADSMP